MIADFFPTTFAANDCSGCGHSARLHSGEGCVVRRCDCDLRADQVPVPLRARSSLGVSPQANRLKREIA
jgi:hypothetical protein